MKDKVVHFLAGMLVYGISMLAITYMFYGKINWYQTIGFAVFMGLADVFIFEKLRQRKK